MLWFTLESAVDEVYWLNAVGTVRFANHTATRNLGWARKDLIGMNIASFQRDMPEGEFLVPLNLSLVDVEGEEVFEAVHVRRDGSIYPVSVHRREFPGEGDLKYLVFARDTAHRHEYARQLKQAETEKTMILNAIHENLVLYDQDFRIVWANDDPAESSGHSPDELPGRLCYELFYGREAPCEGCTVQRVMETRTPITEERRLLNGKFVKISAYPVFADTGELIGVVESCLDISKRKHAEKRYRELFSTMQNGFVVLEHYSGTDTDGDDLVFLEVNPAFEQLSGRCETELIGNTCRSLFPERETIISRYAAVAKTGESMVFDDYNPIFNRHFCIQAYSPKKGQVAALYTDNTEIVNLNEQKKQSLIQIERNFEQLAILNDEIRNPLQVIIGLSLLSPAEESEKILSQAYVIDKLVNKLDQRWLESEKIRDFLRKHYAYA
ncbi:PAS domain-containing protein [Methanogenium sp. S4BF]|uniref:PAS domain-containing protein n=1 Tax=Methanogenium sp. S4BF TaxID=1789226 RepID=UPI0024172480|nr:PAS domain-containing protein [Methanogenium sp. S4BF]WFN34032.1 PAS domain-containing protein [Methanogenium sp. S4BF]